MRSPFPLYRSWNGWGGFSPTDGATLGSGLLANFVGIIAIFAWSGTLWQRAHALEYLQGAGGVIVS